MSATRLIDRQPLNHAAAWLPSDFPSPDAYAVDLSEAQVSALVDGARAALEAGQEIERVDPKGVVFRGLDSLIEQWREKILYGQGFLYLRGLPVDLPDAEYEAIFWGLGGRFGTAVSQSNMGDLLGHVVDVGGDDFRERAYRNRRELSMHTDRCDVVGMMCLQQAKSGGLSSYASALSVYNHVVSTRPELVEPLVRGFYYHRFGEQAESEPGVTQDRVPIISAEQGEVSIVYLRAYIEMAAKENDDPLTDLEREALDYFDDLCNSDEFKLTMMLQRGDIIFFNNCAMVHKRTAFEDHDDPALRRHLLRLWLMAPDRPVTPALARYKGYGIAAKSDANTYYKGDALVTPEQYRR